MRAIVLALLLLLSSAAPASAEACEQALREVARDQLSAAERALASESLDEVSACTLYAWGRIAEARGETVRASWLYRRALRAPSGGPIAASEIEAREAHLPNDARRVAEDAEGRELADLTAVPTLAMLRELARASMETAGWYPVGGVACRVEHRVHSGALELAIVRVTAERISRDEELHVAVRERDGWRFVSSVGPVVQNGHGWRGALELVDVDARARSFVARARSWAADDDVPPGRPNWAETQLRCALHDDGWSCGTY